MEIVGKWSKVRDSVVGVLREKCDFWGEGMWQKISKLVESCRFGRVRFIAELGSSETDWVKCWWARAVYDKSRDVRVEINDDVDVKQVKWLEIVEETSRQRNVAGSSFVSNLLWHSVRTVVRHGSGILRLLEVLGIQLPKAVSEVVDFDDEFELAVVCSIWDVYLCSKFGYWKVPAEIVTEKRPVRWALVVVAGDYRFKDVSKHEIEEFLMQKAMSEAFGGDGK